jgi:hypothetical protein
MFRFLSAPVTLIVSHQSRTGKRVVRSLAERLRAHEQQKARLAEQEAKLKDAERKARTRRLIEAGGLVEKTGLLGLDANALYGALLSLRDGVDNPKQVEQWTALGGRAFAREARLRDEGKEPLVLTFPSPLAKDATAPLRAAGFRFNKVFQHWEGLARFAEAEPLAASHGGMARRVTPLPAPTADQQETAAA